MDERTIGIPQVKVPGCTCAVSGQRAFFYFYFGSEGGAG